MREVNLLNFYMIKMVEVILLIGMTVAIIVSTFTIASHKPLVCTTAEDEEVCVISTKTKSFGEDQSTTCIQLYVLCVLALFHTLHNNFLTNMRLACRATSSTWACCWKPINYLICKFGKGDQMNGLQFCCRDRCCKPQTIVK